MADRQQTGEERGRRDMDGYQRYSQGYDPEADRGRGMQGSREGEWGREDPNRRYDQESGYRGGTQSREYDRPRESGGGDWRDREEMGQRRYSEEDSFGNRGRSQRYGQGYGGGSSGQLGEPGWRSSGEQRYGGGEGWEQDRRASYGRGEDWRYGMGFGSMGGRENYGQERQWRGEGYKGGQSGQYRGQERYGQSMDYGDSGQGYAQSYGPRYGLDPQSGMSPSGRMDDSGKGYGPYAGKGPKDYKRADDAIRNDACETLTQHDRIDATEINVSVLDGQVTLSGSVDDRKQRRMAEDAVMDLSGVKDVSNQLRIGGKPAYQAEKEERERQESMQH